MQGRTNPVSPIGRFKKQISHLDTELKVSISNKLEIRKGARKAVLGRAIVDESKVLKDAKLANSDLNWENFDAEQYLAIRKLIVEIARRSSAKDINTMLELTDMFKLMKVDFLARIKQKMHEGIPLNKEENDRMDKMFDHMIQLHKLKHGETKTIQKLDVTLIRKLTE